MRNTFGPIEFGQSGFDFGQEHKALYCIVESGVWRHCLESFDNSIASKWFLHTVILMDSEPPVEVSIPGTAASL